MKEATFKTPCVEIWVLISLYVYVVIGSHAYSCVENVECTRGQHNGFYVLSLWDMWSAQRQFGTLTLGNSFASVNVYNLHALLISLRGARKANSAHLPRVLHASMITYDLNKLFARTLTTYEVWSRQFERNI